ncbi:MAG: DUF1501 domain-containing protein [Planctomycetes bacterium]|nr:DUF1501 domain-containing protein [Planctomycetota bacterium]
MKTPHDYEKLRQPHYVPAMSRRDMLVRGGGGFGALALTYLLGLNKANASSTLGGAVNPLAARPPHFMTQARSVIFLFMEGGPSHLDTFDHKPLINELAGKPVPASFGKVITAMGEAGSPILASKRQWRKYGKSGIEVSDWLPHIAECVDDMTIVRSCVSDGINHAGGVCQMNTGSLVVGRPSLGSWITYGLGTENQDMPAFVVMLDGKAQVVGGPRMWGAGFMPAVYQGMRLSSGGEPIPNLMSPSGVSDARQRSKLAMLASMNQSFADRHADNTELDARIRSYELAFRMQAEAPDVVDISGESAATRAMYGMDRKETESFGGRCLLARRLVERGVRFVQLYHGAGSQWDAHSHIESNHTKLCGEMDLPVAGLLRDLKQRGLLESTLVIWGGEFGRTPMSEKGDGRDHNPTGFTMWMAGAGLPGGRVIGATDEVGLHAVQDRVHVHDIHASICHMMGLDHTKLLYLHKGRPERIDMNEGNVSEKLVNA